jgi:hypothetical protein
LSGAHDTDFSIPNVPIPGSGTDAEGHFGFALGLSGFGGDDWLLPSHAEVEPSYRLFNVLS